MRNDHDLKYSIYDGQENNQFLINDQKKLN